MKLRDLRLWLGLIAAGAVLAFVWANFGRTMPGPLSSVHGSHPDLSGMGSCANCHGGWFSDMTESCLSCHDAVEAHIETGAGLHGVLGEEVRHCGRCHSEQIEEHNRLEGRGIVFDRLTCNDCHDVQQLMRRE